MATLRKKGQSDRQSRELATLRSKVEELQVTLSELSSSFIDRELATADIPGDQDIIKPGEPMGFKEYVILCPDERQDKVRDLTDDEKKLLEKVAAQVKDRAKLTDSIEMEAYRKNTPDKIDDVIKAKKKELETYEEDELPTRLRAVMWALAQYVDADTQKEYRRDRRSAQKSGSCTSFPGKSWKCNKFVADAYATGANKGLATKKSDEKGFHGAKDQHGNTWPPLANSLASKTEQLRNLSKAKELADACPQNGDVLAFPADVGPGHASLFLGNGLIVSAKGTGVEVGTVDHEKGKHGGKARVRQYKGK